MTIVGATAVGSIFLVAATVQVVGGFGFAIVAVPLLTFVLSPATAVQCAILVEMPLILFVSLHEASWVHKRAALRLGGWSLVGVPLGVIAMHALEGRVLSIGLGILVLALAVTVRRPIRSAPAAPWSACLGGTLSGLLMGVSAMSGPPLVAALRHFDLQPREVRATASVVFALQGTVAIVILLATSSLGHRVPMAAALGATGVAAGWLVGNPVFARVDANRFTSIVVVLIAISALVTIVRAAVA